jgi:hypothetical protein
VRYILIIEHLLSIVCERGFDDCVVKIFDFEHKPNITTDIKARQTTIIKCMICNI